MACLSLNNLSELGTFAQCLAKELLSPLPIFLHGQLGAGKTALTSALVGSLPGGTEAEVASPSFTIYNLYPTTPPVLHCDLYRCHEDLPAEILDFLDGQQGLLIVEWAEYFPNPPKERLDFFFNVVNDKRLVEIRGRGNAARALIERLAHCLPIAAS